MKRWAVQKLKLAVLHLNYFPHSFLSSFFDYHILAMIRYIIVGLEYGRILNWCRSALELYIPPRKWYLA